MILPVFSRDVGIYLGRYFLLGIQKVVTLIGGQFFKIFFKNFNFTQYIVFFQLVTKGGGGVSMSYIEMNRILMLGLYNIMI